MLSEPWFYFLAVPAVLVYGIGKGGLGGALGILAVPMMALVVPPTQAAAILLPILLVMDAFAVRHHYRSADYQVLKAMLPGAILGVVLAGLFLRITPEAGLKLTVGVLSLLFCLQYWLRGTNPPAKTGTFGVWLWSALSGFSSTAIHAGGGPASIYLLPLRLPKVTLIATMAVLFAIINVVKLVPYFWLGEFDSTNLMTALVLIPLAPVGVKLGVALLHRVSQEKIYQLCYLFLFLSGAKLTWDGVVALLV
ncbi:sulfite exporter TauE/SafE family protein [Vibrio sp. CAU 1672]|uniref:sulfite exporter TauE/SafE family protein n=1 Tax=Vibrio sp. CAU 1672 TaxID=3032594 RepID=UPI0023D9A3FA|nr:sulfite exporter TauE/SafE family protein [Vibrio sp. CAU 1672]MDF2153048.1 sulfite exporter TauE/SafE family protein [Vibrio sp. CAU 1672]